LTILGDKLSALKEENVLDVMYMIKKKKSRQAYISEDVEGIEITPNPSNCELTVCQPRGISL
jgi:hypothetical protein